MAGMNDTGYESNVPYFAAKSGEIASVSPVTSRLPNSDPRRNRAKMMNMPP